MAPGHVPGMRPGVLGTAGGAGRYEEEPEADGRLYGVCPEGDGYAQVREGISIKPLDRRGNHAKLARYLMKETRRTAERYREAGKRYKRFSCAKGMVQPEPVYHVIRAASWAKEPRPRKGYVLLKDDNGATCRSGVHEVNGWPWQEYFELRVEPPGLPVKQKAPPRRRRRNRT